MGAYIPLAVNSRIKRKVASLLKLRLNPATFGMPANLSDHTAKSHPQRGQGIL
jgi:hypothetical protein